MPSYSIVSSAVLVVVALVSLVFTILVWMAAERAGARRVRFVAAGFGILFLKSAFVLSAIRYRFVDHELLEMIDAVADLVLVLMITVPFWLRE